MKNLIILPILGSIALFLYLQLNKEKKTVDVIIDLEKETPPLLSPIVPVKPAEPSPTERDTLPVPPYEQHGFGIDIRRNTDNNELDDYMNLPLTGSGKTYSNTLMAEIDADSLDESLSITKYKYVRLTVNETREFTNSVGIDDIAFYNGNYRIEHVKIWNPHTGYTSKYDGPWEDSDTKSTVFIFREPVLITGYKIKTSRKDVSNDPASWMLEASKNASYWNLINEEDEDLPLDRGVFSRLFKIRTNN